MVEKNTNDQHVERYLISFLNWKNKNKTIFSVISLPTLDFLTLLKCWDIFILNHLLIICSWSLHLCNYLWGNLTMFIRYWRCIYPLIQQFQYPSTRFALPTFQKYSKHIHCSFSSKRNKSRNNLNIVHVGIFHCIGEWSQCVCTDMEWSLFMMRFSIIPVFFPEKSLFKINCNLPVIYSNTHHTVVNKAGLTALMLLTS